MPITNQEIDVDVVRNEEISLKELILNINKWIKYIWSKWLLILAIAITGSILGILYSLISKPTYTASTTFVLEDENGSGGLGGLAGLASVAGLDIGGGGGGIFQGENIFQLYTSRKMLEKTLLTSVEDSDKGILLVDKYIAINKLREDWESKPELSNLKFSVDSLQGQDNVIKVDRIRDSILGVIVADVKKNYLTVSKPDKKLSAIQVDVKAKDELFAKSFNDYLVRNVNEFYIQTKTKKTLKNVSILQHKVDSVRRVMNGAIYTAVEVVDATPNLNPTRQVQRVAPAQKAQFSAETNKAILAEMVKNLELTKMSLLKETPLIQVIDGPVYPLKKDRFGKLKGIVIGGFIFGFLTIVYLTFRRLIKGILA